MHVFFSSVKAVGFDLDRTLYSDTSEISERVAQEIFKAILKLKPELKTTENVETIYRKRGRELRSWSRVLKEIGVEDSQKIRKIVNECLNSADIADLIKEDQKLVQILEQLSLKFVLFLITGSIRSQAIKKLVKIGVRAELFNFSLFGDDSYSLTESFDKNFQYFLSQSPYQPSEHVYIGDNLQADTILPKSFGMKTILVGNYSEEADFSIANIHDIEHLLLP